MNTVTISGTLVRRGDDIENRRLPKVFLEVYNPEVRDVLVCVVYGRLRALALPEELRDGSQVEITGRLANVHWRTPAAGRMVREIGVEVHKVGLVGEEAVDLQPPAPRRRTTVRATPAQVAEINRLAGQLQLGAEDLKDKYLGGRDPQDVPRNEAVEILQQMAQDVHAAGIPAGAQLDRMVPANQSGEGDAQVEEWVNRLLETPVQELAAGVEALPDVPEVRQAVVEESLRREKRKGAKELLGEILEKMGVVE